MNEQGEYIAALLEASSKAYAVGALLRIQEIDSQSTSLVASWGFSDMVGDIQLRISHLIEALACGRPEILALDVEWVSATFMSRDVPVGFLVTSLECLRDELMDSLPENAKVLAREYLEYALDHLAKPTVPPESHLESAGPHRELALTFLNAILEADRARAEALILEALDSGVSVPEIHTHVIAKVQRELGRMWQFGECYISDEHFGSRLVEDVLNQLRIRMPRESGDQELVLIASVPGNLHDIGARMVSHRFAMHGWRTIFLGANMPSADLVRSAKRHAPKLICLSLGQSTDLRSAASTIASLRAEVPGVAISVGGGPLGLIEGLWSDLGADACTTTIGEAIEFGAEVLAR